MRLAARQSPLRAAFPQATHNFFSCSLRLAAIWYKPRHQQDVFDAFRYGTVWPPRPSRFLHTAARNIPFQQPTVAGDAHKNGSKMEQVEQIVNEAIPKNDTHQQPRIKLNGKVPRVESADPKDWLPLLDLFLPEHLRITTSSIISPSSPPEDDRTKLLRILATARLRSSTGRDLLAYAIHEANCHDAVLYLVKFLLDGLDTFASFAAQDRPPSNIAWPKSYIGHFAKQPISVDSKLYASTETVEEWTTEKIDYRYSTVMSAEKDATVQQIWTTVGEAIIASTELQPEDARTVMSTVHRIVAQVHNLGLIPEDIYSFVPSGLSSNIHRPPILHLLSARMLTALSDAVWRSQANESMLKAFDKGVDYKDYKELGRDPPGGRFRLKVRELGPEVWLEFVLWCCADGGFGRVGANLVKSMKKQRADPWFAINWTPHPGRKSFTPVVDWGRVRSRPGGPVGSSEGYSKEAPFVEMPHRTISAEVVQALIEVMLNSTSVNQSGSGIPIDVVQREIVDLVTFLEPHDLPTEYFDYLSVRLSHTNGIDHEQHPAAAHSLWDMSSSLKRLESSKPKPVPRVDFSYVSIMHHSELQAGLLHQSLQSYMNALDVREAMESFAQIQQLVDTSKLRAIGSFLSSPNDAEDGFFSSRSSFTLMEFVDSHGQLPYHQMAGFLNMITEFKLFRLGSWLFYSDDVDGPLIPPQAYGQTCLTTPIAKFATASRDAELMIKMLRHRKKSLRMPTIALLRALFNANISFGQYRHAHRLLREMRSVRGGGYGYSNLAYLAATILRLERSSQDVSHLDSESQMKRAVAMLQEILSGKFTGSVGDYTTATRREFRQQVGFLLRIFQNIGSTTLSQVAASFQDLYPTGNLAALKAPTFNVILEAVVETQGAVAGKKLWDSFCTSPRMRNLSNPIHDLLNDGYEEEDVDHDDWSVIQHGREIVREEGFPSLHVESASNNSGLNLAIGGSELSGGHREAVGIPLEFAVADSSDLLDRLLPFPQGKKAKLVSSTDPSPIVVPDIRTLRILVRAAVSEKNGMGDQGDHINQRTPQAILEWAVHLYHILGVSKTIIEQEVQQNVSHQLLIAPLRKNKADLLNLQPSDGPKMVIQEVGRGTDVKRQFNSASFETQQRVQI